MDFTYSVSERETANRVRNMLGVPDIFIAEGSIICYEVLETSQNYILKSLKDYKGEITEEHQKRIESAIIIYSAYLLCDESMLLRVPTRMESIDSKTQLQEIEWGKLAEKLLSKANVLINDLLEAMDLPQIIYGVTISSLTTITPYPNQSI